MIIRALAMIALIVGKTIAGADDLQPVEMLANVLELTAVFAAGYHIAHHYGREKEAHGEDEDAQLPLHTQVGADAR